MSDYFPAFTLSLDCEGLWGMADQCRIVDANVISDASLREAYGAIAGTLQKNGLRATAAFVTCFASEQDAIRENIDLLEEMAELNPGWFERIVPSVKRGTLDGWRGSAFYRDLAAAGHEMAWHGTTHLSLSEKTLPQALELELELASRLFRELGHTPRTIVFPGNQIGHLGRLKGYGFETYRASLPKDIPSRLTGLANEWNVFSRHAKEMPTVRDGWEVSPAGHFLNWPSGIRAMVPTLTTVRRWKSILRSAAENGGYVHMWFHPHNLITAPAMKAAFEEIMHFAGGLVKSGDMANLLVGDANRHYRTGTMR